MDSAVVLYVGSSDGATALRQQVASDSFFVRSATDEQAALSVLESSTIDCVVVEAGPDERPWLPVVEGVRAAAPSLPVLVFGPADAEPLVQSALDAGATGYVPDVGTTGTRLLGERLREVRARHTAEQRATRLDHISAVIRNINRALLYTDSRAALEERVCEILTESEPYRFAWIGRLDPETNAIEPRAGVGHERGYLDEVSVTADDTAQGQGPAGRAIRTGEIQVCQDIASDATFDPWREAALSRGFRSVAAVPLSYDGESYGALFVYADRTDVFDATEQELLEDVGDDIAYASNTLALRDEVQRLADFFEHAPLGVFIAEPGPGGVVLDANPEMATMLGADRSAELVGRPVTEFYADTGEGAAILDTLREDGKASRELELRTVRGQSVWGLLTVVLSEQADGSSVIVGAIKDITDERHIRTRLNEHVTELRQTEQELQQRQSQISFFNNLLRHEVLNGMTVILGATDRLLGDADDDELRAEVERIDARGTEIVETVQRVRRVLCRLTADDPEFDVCDLTAVVEGCVEQLRMDYPAARVTVDTPASAAVVADELLDDVVYNVLVNAAQHNDAGEPEIAVSVAHDEGATVLEIADNGPGIDPEVRDTVFGRDGWQTSPASASGFGLHFVETMVTQYGGSVRVEDREPRGSTVVLELRTADTA